MASDASPAPEGGFDRRRLLRNAGLAAVGGAGITALNEGVAAAAPSPTAINVLDISPDCNDGSHDARPAIQQAINNPAGRRDVWLPAGTYKLDSMASGVALGIAPGTAGLRIRGEGAGATVIKLTANCPRAFDLARTADHQTFRNIEIADLTIDCDGVTTDVNTHVVLGNLPDGEWSNYINVENLAVRRVRSVNVPAQTTVKRTHISVASRRPSDAGPGNTITDVLVEDCDLRGGGGIYFGGRGPAGDSSGVDVHLDRIRIHRTRHDVGWTQVAPVGHANLQLGGVGRGGSCEVVDCHFARSGDVGIEIDSMTYSHVERTIVEDAYNAGFFVRNFATPPDQEAQVARFRDCEARLTAGAVPVSAANGSNRGAGFALSHADQTNNPTFGHVVLDGCSFTSRHPDFSVPGQAIYAVGPVNRITIRDFTSVQDAVDFTNSSGTQRYPCPIYIRPRATSLVHVHGLHMRVSGTKSGAQATIWRGLDLAPKGTNDLAFVLEGVTVDFAVAGQSNYSTTAVTLGGGTLPDAPGTMRGTVRGLVVKQLAGGDGAPAGINVGGTQTLQLDEQIRVVDCDFSAGPAGLSGRELTFSGTTKNRDRVLERGNTYQAATFRPPAAVTSGFESGNLTGTHPVVYRNLDGVAQLVAVVVPTGADMALMKVETSRDVAGPWFDTGAKNGRFHLDPGDFIRVDYDPGAPPALSKVPRK